MIEWLCLRQLIDNRKCAASHIPGAQRVHHITSRQEMDKGGARRWITRIQSSIHPLASNYVFPFHFLHQTLRLYIHLSPAPPPPLPTPPQSDPSHSTPPPPPPPSHPPTRTPASGVHSLPPHAHTSQTRADAHSHRTGPRHLPAEHPSSVRYGVGGAPGAQR